MLTAACTAGPVDGSPESTVQRETTVIQGVKWADGSEVQARTLDLNTATEEVIGDYFDSYASMDRWTGASELFGTLALTDQGELIGEFSHSMQPTRGDTELSSRGEIGVVRDDEFEAFASTENLVAGDGNRMVVDAATDNDTIVWVETAHFGDATSTWRIFTGGPGKETELMAKAEDYSDFLRRPSFDLNPVPVIDDDAVYWQGLLDDGEGNLSVSVFGQQAASGNAAEIIARNANDPVVLDSGVAVTDTMVDLEPGEEIDPARSPIRGQGISIVDRGTRTALLELTEPEDEETTLGTLSGGGQTLLTTVNDRLLVINVETREVLAVTAPEAETEGFTFFATGPEVCGDYATWTYRDPGGASNGEQYFLDLETSELGKIPEEKLFGKVFCNEEYFAWMVLDDADTRAAAHAEVMEWRDD